MRMRKPGSALIPSYLLKTITKAMESSNIQLLYKAPAADLKMYFLVLLFTHLLLVIASSSSCELLALRENRALFELNWN